MRSSLHSQVSYWIPDKIWPDETVFVIGGGSSLTTFDWLPLHNKNIIGCNDAYLLGDWVDVCLFGDKIWWEAHEVRPEFVLYSGLKICCAHFSGSLDDKDLSHWMHCSGVKIIQRTPLGLRTDGCVAWNWSTGATAINLAVLLGAKRIVLLGYDMKGNNWHQDNLHSSPPDFERFKKGFEAFAKGLEELNSNIFNAVEVLNAGPDSDLDVFPKVKLEDVL